MNKEQRERQQSAIVVLESDNTKKQTNVMKSEYRPKVMNMNGYVVL